MDGFGWRISVATLAQSGPFSAFVGVDRQIMLLDGDGVRLHNDAAQINHLLTTRWQPFAFSGDVPLDCDMQGGTSSDFNVMTRRGEWTARLEVWAGDSEVTKVSVSSPHGLCMVLQGEWSDADGRNRLGFGQGFFWNKHAALQLQSSNADARIVLVSVFPTGHS